MKEKGLEILLNKFFKITNKKNNRCLLQQRLFKKLNFFILLWEHDIPVNYQLNNMFLYFLKFDSFFLK